MSLLEKLRCKRFCNEKNCVAFTLQDAVMLGVKENERANRPMSSILFFALPAGLATRDLQR